MTSNETDLPKDLETQENIDPAIAEVAESAEAATSDVAQAEATKLSPVAFMEDPFGLRTIEISSAQNNSDELDLDKELLEELEDELDQWIDESPEARAAVDSRLDQLAVALHDEMERAAEEWKTDADANFGDPESAKKAAEELAAQIAEEEELVKALEAQAAAQEAEEAEEVDPELAAALPQPVVDGQVDLRELESCIESLLFMVDKPLSLNRLRELLQPATAKPEPVEGEEKAEGEAKSVDASQADAQTDEVASERIPHSAFLEALTSLRDRYRAYHHGIEIVEVGGGYQFRTKPVRAPLAKKLAKVQTQRLSSGAMESLAIVAYRQPVLKDDIDKIRGVDSSYFIRTLLDRKLIQICGRSELPGRPMLYGTTDAFLELFGLKDLASMPSLRELEQMVPSSETAGEDEDPRIKEMRQLVSKMKSDSSTNLAYDPREDEKILKEIRERVSAIPTSTPYLDEQKALEKQAAAEAAAQAKLAAEQAAQPELVTEAPVEASAPVPDAPVSDA